MHKRFMGLILALMMGIPAAGLAELAAKPTASATAEIDAGVDRIFKSSKATGASVVIVKDGKMVYARDYGFRNRAKKLPVTENTYFKVASVSKMVTGIAVMRLVEQGKLKLDEDISSYLGFKAGNPYKPNSLLTLRQIMSHTGSYRDEGGYSVSSKKLSDLITLSLKRLGNFHNEEPGSVYRYSNFGSGIAESLIEAVTGQNFILHMNREIFEPLKIDASYAASLLKNPDEVADIYDKGDLALSAKRYINLGFDASVSPDSHFRICMGKLFIRSRDLAKIAVALCGDGQVDGFELLKPESLEMMRAKQNSLGLSVKGDSPYGLFTHRAESILPGVMLYGHQGMSNGAVSDVYFDPETQFVFVMTSNGCSTARDRGTIIMAKRLIEYLYPLYAQ